MRFRLAPTPAQEAMSSRQLTAARRELAWSAAGSRTVRRQALRFFAQSMSDFFAGTHRRPTWRKAGGHEGFRIVGRRGRRWDVRRLSRKVGEVWVAKVGWVRFGWSRRVPEEVKSFRVTADQADVNAAENIAAGRAVTCSPRPAHPGRPPVWKALQPLGGAVNRGPQPVLTSG
jgi:hypothetical protein